MSANPITRLARQLPDWASLRHPVVGYIWPKTTFQGPRWMRWLGYGLVTTIVIGLTVVTNQGYTTNGIEDLLLPAEREVYVTFYPVLILLQICVTFGFMMHVMLVGLTPAQTPFDQAQQAWELAKVSGNGAELVIQARWFVMFRRAINGYLLILSARGLFILLIISDWLDQPALFHTALDGAHPHISDPVAFSLFVLGFIMLLVLPITTSAWYLAIGTLLFTQPRSRWINTILQRVILFVILVLLSVSLIIGLDVLHTPGLFDATDWQKSVSLLTMIVIWDQGLRILSRPALLHIVESVDFALWFGVPLALIAVLQVLTTPWLLRWAARIAGRPTKI